MKILHSINPPPPVGGVTVSMKNLHDSLISIGELSYYKRDFQLCVRYDIGHIHASNMYKRLLCIVLMNFFCKKVVFTVHGLSISDCFVNRLSLKLADGVIFLNQKIYNFWENKTNKNFVVLPSLFKEGAPVISKSDGGNRQNTTVLLYSQSRYLKDGQEVYGIEFALKALVKSDIKYNVILVDLDGGYQDLVSELGRVIDIQYYPHPVVFSKVLSACDIYLRPTCMDGSSVAIQEALLHGKKVIASDVVDRGGFVEVYKHLDINSFIETLKKTETMTGGDFSLSSVHDYLEFIKTC
jgi:glycosyltransferase involved in cell wall biosynthesis